MLAPFYKSADIIKIRQKLIFITVFAVKYIYLLIIKKIMGLNFKGFQEYVRIKNGALMIKAVIVSGKDGDFFVVVSPTLVVSGYGETEEDAKNSFESNMLLLCEDLMAITQEQRDIYLKELGFEKVKYHNKDYSKVYVDENGVLKGMDLGNLKISTVETKTAC